MASIERPLTRRTSSEPIPRLDRLSLHLPSLELLTGLHGTTNSLSLSPHTSPSSSLSSFPQSSSSPSLSTQQTLGESVLIIPPSSHYAPDFLRGHLELPVHLTALRQWDCALPSDVSSPKAKQNALISSTRRLTQDFRRSSTLPCLANTGKERQPLSTGIVSSHSQATLPVLDHLQGLSWGMVDELDFPLSLPPSLGMNGSAPATPEFVFRGLRSSWIDEAQYDNVAFTSSPAQSVHIQVTEHSASLDGTNTSFILDFPTPGPSLFFPPLSPRSLDEAEGVESRVMVREDRSAGDLVSLESAAHVGLGIQVHHGRGLESEVGLADDEKIGGADVLDLISPTNLLDEKDPEIDITPFDDILSPIPTSQPSEGYPESPLRAATPTNITPLSSPLLDGEEYGTFEVLRASILPRHSLYPCSSLGITPFLEALTQFDTTKVMEGRPTTPMVVVTSPSSGSGKSSSWSALMEVEGGEDDSGSEYGEESPIAIHDELCLEDFMLSIPLNSLTYPLPTFSITPPSSPGTTIVISTDPSSTLDHLRAEPIYPPSPPPLIATTSRIYDKFRSGIPRHRNCLARQMSSAHASITSLSSSSSTNTSTSLSSSSDSGPPSRDTTSSPTMIMMPPKSCGELLLDQTFPRIGEEELMFLWEEFQWTDVEERL